MCRGCSGDIEGDGDDREFGGSDPLERESERPEGITREVNVAGSAGAGSPHRMTGVEDYEVLVSDERIVERRTIRANCPAINCSARAASTARTRRTAALEAAEAWQESRRGRRQSLGWTAKYYRTQGEYESARPHGSGEGSRCLMWWYLAWLGALALVIWLAVF
jgi:hypothetical protein